jgi:magnesium transporter
MLRERVRTPDFIYFVYVVDDDQHRKLQGVLSLRDLLVADESDRVEALMNRHLVALAPLDSPREAAYRLLRSQLAALPVVGGEGELLGAVTVDVAVAQVAPANWRSQAPRIFS